MKKLLTLLLLIASASCSYALMAPGNNIISRKVAEESIVLLRNEESALPLTKSDTVAVFGPGQIGYIKGGGGSAWVHTYYSVPVPEGIKHVAAEGMVGFYEPLYNEYRADSNITITVEKAKEIARHANTALLCVAHGSGEGFDRKIDKGDWFLSEKEEETLAAISKAGFKKVIVVLNTVGVIDTSWVDVYKPQGVLWCSAPGIDGGDAVANILTGKVNPSGKLTDTWARDINDYPSTEGFFTPGHVDYTEGIYVGYRYFRTFNKAARYPFGHGLSYTTFDIANKGVKLENENIVVTAKVTNKGARAGKEVVQVYVKAPRGKLDKPAMELRGFAKTKLLSPGESQTLTITFPKYEAASYDEYGDTGHKAAWVLEAGDYHILVGDSLDSAAKNVFGKVNVPQTLVTKQLANRFNPTKLEKVLTADGTYRPVPTYDPEAGKIKPIDIAADSYTIIEGEDYSMTYGDSGRQHFSYPDGRLGVCMAWTQKTNGGAKYPVSVAKAGKYDIYFAIAGRDNDGGFRITFDDKDVGEVKNVRPTGGWFDFRYITAAVDLPAGAGDLAFRTTKPYGNIDRFIIVPAGNKSLYEAALKSAETLSVPEPKYAFKERTQVGSGTIYWEDVLRDHSLLNAFISQLADEDLARITQGFPNKVIGDCGDIGGLTDFGCYGLETTDGGQGVKLGGPAMGYYTTCMPSTVLVTCSWNIGIIDEYCKAIAKEMELNKVDIWLAPGLNIHRNPLCGRNFEYMSEDPLITGLFAAKFVRCAHKYGYFSMIKHFCANNREFERTTVDTRVSDRAMREIYLRGFQRAVEEGDALFIMSSYNLINGTEVSESKNILTDILRGEWGYRGLVSTDWGNNSNQTREVLAGNNVKMYAGNHSDVMFDLANGVITHEKLVQNARTIFGTILRAYDIRAGK